MVKPQDDKLLQLLCRPTGDKPFHRFIYVLPVGIDLVDGRPAQITPVGTHHSCADRFIVAVEDIVIVWIAGPVALAVRDEYKGFPKPGGMTKMPFGRAHVHDGLYDIVLFLQRVADGFAGLSNSAVLFK